jgi:hypothetical protein
MSYSHSIELACGMPDWSSGRAKRRRTRKHTGPTMTTATQYAGLATLLALATASPSFAQSRTAMENGYPSHYCLPTTIDSSDDQKVYCEGWRAFRKGW